eukprot:1117520-Pleurochrysis_carterae.AAC.1
MRTRGHANEASSGVWAAHTAYLCTAHVAFGNSRVRVVANAPELAYLPCARSRSKKLRRACAAANCASPRCALLGRLTIVLGLPVFLFLELFLPLPRLAFKCIACTLYASSVALSTLLQLHSLRFFPSLNFVVLHSCARAPN